MITATEGGARIAARGYRALVGSPSLATSAVDEVPLWYHTLELPGRVLTPGWFDLRAQVDRLPWPEVTGKRCLDIGTYDGFYAFELERRGAAEVVAVDISDHEHWDWPFAARARGGEALRRLAGEKGRGFEVARTALGSNVERVASNVYELDATALGSFDVVVCGSLLLHLRDPVHALEAIRSVCGGWLMSVEAISLPLSLIFRRRPVAELSTDDELCQWWTVNTAGHRRLVEAAGFEVLEATGPFAERFGPGYPKRERRAWNGRAFVASLLRRLFAGADGVPHAALLARPSAMGAVSD
jgi:tRNA (mo5U34)-methyltransferase